jgi:hypothetical protein
MTITTALDGPIVVNSVVGAASADEIVIFIAEHSRQWGEAVLYDLTRITTENWESIVNKSARFGRANRRVALVGWKDFVFGMLHMFEAFAAMADDPQEYQVFRDIAPAKAWLVSSRVGS